MCLRVSQYSRKLLLSWRSAHKWSLVSCVLSWWSTTGRCRGKALVTRDRLAAIKVMKMNIFLDQFLNHGDVDVNLFRHHDHSSRVNNSSNFTAAKDERLYLICLRSLRVWIFMQRSFYAVPGQSSSQELECMRAGSELNWPELLSVPNTINFCKPLPCLIMPKNCRAAINKQ